MSEQFQTNVNRFIDYVKNKINSENNNINTYELISEHLYNLIIANTKEQNISIINYYSGSIISAIYKLLDFLISMILMIFI